MKFDLTKYETHGWGLFAFQLIQLEGILLNKNNSINNIIEFGSGMSTEFLCDLRIKHDLNYFITSFDHHTQYCYKKSYPFLDLKIRDLVSCDDKSYEEQFLNKKYNKSVFYNSQYERDNLFVKNSFYDIQEGDIPEGVDLVILDGPSGNGRSLSFIHLLNKLNKGAYILIDDCDHYDFIDRCISILDADVLLHEKRPDVHWNCSSALLRIK